MQKLSSLGFGSFFQEQYDTMEQDLLPARVAADYGEEYGLFSEEGAPGPLRELPTEPAEADLDQPTRRVMRHPDDEAMPLHRRGDPTQWMTQKRPDRRPSGAPVKALKGHLSGKLRYQASSALELPAVGDWVAIRSHGEGAATIVRVFARKSQLIRQAAGRRTSAQVLAANLDTVLIVSSMNQEFNERRLERYLAMVFNSGAKPVVLLSKADLPEDPGSFLERATRVARGAPVVAVSALGGVGFTQLSSFLRPGETVALVGSSGVGKSTLVNWLLGEERQAVRESRGADDKGRHTTTHRELIVLPHDRGLLLDTPGMRELQVWTGEEGLEQTFEDVEALVSGCFFRDCQHSAEPGCAVREAVERGELPAERWQSYRKLRREEAFQSRKVDEQAVRQERERNRKLGKLYRQIQREKNKRR